MLIILLTIIVIASACCLWACIREINEVLIPDINNLSREIENMGEKLEQHDKTLCSSIFDTMELSNDVQRLKRKLDE